MAEIQPDSQGYMNLNETRQTSYFFIGKVLKWLHIDITIFQNVFLSFSIVFLTIFIMEKTNIFFSLVSYILIVSNTYYTSFSKIILTESILFSLFNLAIVFLFLEKKKNKFDYFCINLWLFSFIKAHRNPNFVISNILIINKN